MNGAPVRIVIPEPRQLPPARRLGLGDAASDAYQALVAAINNLQTTIIQAQQNAPSDLVLSSIGQQANALTNLLGNYVGAASAEASGSGASYSQQIQILQSQLNQAKAQLATATGDRALAPTSPVPASGVSTPAVAFIAVGSLFAGGVAGWSLRGAGKKRT